jgi:hypothetical protein
MNPTEFPAIAEACGGESVTVCVKSWGFIWAGDRSPDEREARYPGHSPHFAIARRRRA